MLVKLKLSAVSFPMLIAIMLTAGCSSDLPHDGANGGIANDSVTNNNVIAAPAVSPIDEYLNLLAGTHLSTEARIQRLDQEVIQQEDFIAECMAEFGFTYYPNPARYTHSFSDGVEWRTNDPEWLAHYGFGVMVWPGVQEGELLTIAGQVGQRDPNIEHTNSLSEAEREAHFLALLGSGTMANPYEWETDPELHQEYQNDPANWGCHQKAFAQRVENTAFGLRDSEEFTPLFEAIDNFRADLALDVTEADRDWAICMHDVGQSGFDRRPDFPQMFRDQQSAIWNSLIESNPNWDWSRYPEGMGSINHPEFGALYEQETEMALLDLRCREATNFDARQQQHVYELETQFVNDHRAAFNALRNAIEQLG